MSYLEKLKSTKGQENILRPVKVLVVAVATTSHYKKGTQERTCTEIGVADQATSMKVLCYDDKKLATLKEGNVVLIRNYIARDSQIVITSKTLVSSSTGVMVDDVIKQQARQLVIIPEAAVQSIAEARHTGLGALVSLQGKVVKEEAISYRDMKSGELRVPVRNITICDGTGETKIGLWRDLTESKTNVETYIKITDLKINQYKGEISFNTTSRTKVTEEQAPVERFLVDVDGSYKDDKENLVLVCNVIGTSTYLDYTCPRDIWTQTFGDNEELTDSILPLRAHVSVKGNEIEQIDLA